MKTFEFFYEGFVILLWLIVVIIHGLSLIYENDYSASNNSIVTFIILGFLQTQIVIKSQIRELKVKK